MVFGHFWVLLWHTLWRDPGFPIGGCQLPRRLHFKKFVCQNERIWTLWGHARRRPLDPPMVPFGSVLVVAIRETVVFFGIRNQFWDY